MLTEALVVSAPGAAFKLQPVNVEDEIRDNEVLIKMKATGVCHTDINFHNETSIPGLFPAVFGHEGKRLIQNGSSAIVVMLVA
jgi:aryl-alcohol dehydrogenase